MEHSHSPDTSTTTPMTTQTLGQLLRQTREKKGLSIEQAAEQTFILKRHLQALEADDFEQLPQPTFARGFVISYARFLGLDSNQAGQLFEQQYPTHLKQKHETVQRANVQPIGTLQRDGRTGIKVNLWMILGSLAALAIMAFLFKTINNAHQQTNSPPTTTSVEGINNQEQATGADLNNAGSAIPTTGVAIDTASVQSGTALTATPSNTASTLASTAVATQVGQSELAFWVQKPATITVTDANGQVLLTGEQTRGAKNLVGKAPFKISIDNVSAVSLDYNKQPIKLSDYAQNNQANFTLN